MHKKLFLLFLVTLSGISLPAQNMLSRPVPSPVRPSQMQPDYSMEANHLPVPSVTQDNLPGTTLSVTQSIPRMALSVTQYTSRPDLSITRDTLRPAVPPGKIILTAGTHAALWTGTYLALNQAWYADYPRESFHFFNDNREWNQIDKAGHVWTTLQVSRVSAEMWKWAGLSSHRGALLGGISGLAYQSIIEIQDGFSSEWGFSWGDMAANLAGASLFSLQQLAWKEQRIQLKMSYWPYRYPAGLTERRDQLFGSSLSERILKDYNSQTYWISGNISAFFPGSRLPRWLNLSIGYASDGMLGGMGNTWTDEDGVTHNRPDIRRTRRFYLAPDIDLTRIPTRSRLVRGIFFALNAIKFPAPALELSAGKLKVHAISF